MTDLDRPAAEPIPGYKKAKPVVFSSIYPMGTDEYEELTKALEKLAINDASLTYKKDSSAALGFGFRCGFLGLLHLDVVQERIQREFGISLVVSAPSVRYKVTLQRHAAGRRQPGLLARPVADRERDRAVHQGEHHAAGDYMGSVMELCRECRAAKQTMNHLAARVEIISEMPLGEVLFDFYGRLKTVTRGYGSFDYEELDYRRATSSRSTSWSTPRRSTRSPTWSIATRRAPGRCTTASNWPRRSRGTSSRSRSRAPSAATSSPARTSSLSART